MLRRIIGVLLIIIATISLVFSLVVTVGVWRLRKPVAEAARAGLELADKTLVATNEALTALNDALENSAGTVVAVQDTFRSLSLSVYAGGPMLESLADFLGEGLPTTLRNTQNTVASAADSARVVDTILDVLSAIPFINFTYEPKTPLSETLDSIAESLRTVPDNMETLSADMSATGATLPELARSLEEFGASISEVDESLARAQISIAAYQGLIEDYQGMIATLMRLIPFLVTMLPLLLSFAIFWLAVVQVAALLKGWQWARGRQVESSQLTQFHQPSA